MLVLDWQQCIISLPHTSCSSTTQEKQAQITRVSALSDAGAGGDRTCWCRRGQDKSRCWVDGDEVLEPREQLVSPHSALFCPGIEFPLHQNSQEPRSVMRAVQDKQEWACPHPDANTDSKHCIQCQLGFVHRLDKAQTPNPASLSRLDPDHEAQFWFW